MALGLDLCVEEEKSNTSCHSSPAKLRNRGGSLTNNQDLIIRDLEASEELLEADSECPSPKLQPQISIKSVSQASADPEATPLLSQVPSKKIHDEPKCEIDGQGKEEGETTFSIPVSKDEIEGLTEEQIKAKIIRRLVELKEKSG